MTNEPVFDSAATTTLDECRAICSQRGGEYADSWHPDNLVRAFTDSAFASFGLPRLSDAQYQILALGVMADVKLSRLGGDWKKDTTVDLCNYVAALTTLRDRYEKSKVPPAPVKHSPAGV